MRYSQKAMRIFFAIGDIAYGVLIFHKDIHDGTTRFATRQIIGQKI
jgi:hypothetical protein